MDLLAVYVDTGAWIALHEPADRHHEAARARLQALRGEGELLVTGWHTVVELVDGLQHHYDQATAATETARLLGSPALRVVAADEGVRREAVEILGSRTDWGVDLSECLSFALMRKLELTRAFAYDGDFEKAGFVRLG